MEKNTKSTHFFFFSFFLYLLSIIIIINSNKNINYLIFKFRSKTILNIKKKNIKNKYLIL